MKFFVDTAIIEEIRELNEYGLLDGVTTNPSLAAKSGRNFRDVIAEICDTVEGPVSAEVVATDFNGMVAEGKRLTQISDKVVVKLPLTLDGLKACRHLTHSGIRTNITLCFSTIQALLAAKAGATYISPFVGRLDDIDIDGMGLVREIVTVYKNYHFNTEIITASVRSANHVKAAAMAGADIVTIPAALIRSLASHVLTDKGLDQFARDWAATGQSIL